MKRLTSDLTFYYKRGFPAVWFGFVALAVIGEVQDMLTGRETSPRALLMACAVGLLSYGLFKVLTFDLADEVLDAGEHLVVRRGRQTERISLGDIADVREVAFMRNPRRVTLRLAKPTRLGPEITFAPAGSGEFSLNPFSPSPIAAELSERAAAARAHSVG